MEIISFFKRIISIPEQKRKEKDERMEALVQLETYYEILNSKIAEIKTPNGEGFYKCRDITFPLNIAAEVYDGYVDLANIGENRKGYSVWFDLQCTDELGNHHVFLEFLLKQESKIKPGRYCHDNHLDPACEGSFGGRLYFKDKPGVWFDFTNGIIDITRENSSITIFGDIEMQAGDDEKSKHKEKLHIEFTGTPVWIKEDC